MKKNEDEIKRESLNKEIVRQNYKILLSLKKVKDNRHVKEENEPLMQTFIDDFNLNYAKNVASKSTIEILKMLKDEI